MSGCPLTKYFRMPAVRMRTRPPSSLQVMWVSWQAVLHCDFCCRVHSGFSLLLPNKIFQTNYRLPTTLWKTGPLFKKQTLVRMSCQEEIRCHQVPKTWAEKKIETKIHFIALMKEVFPEQTLGYNSFKIIYLTGKPDHSKLVGCQSPWALF